MKKRRGWDIPRLVGPPNGAPGPDSARALPGRGKVLQAGTARPSRWAGYRESLVPRASLAKVEKPPRWDKRGMAMGGLEPPTPAL